MERTTLTGKLLLGALYTSIAVAILATAMLAVSPRTMNTSVSIAGEKINVTIADTPTLQEKGLSGRKELKQNEGMLFIFPESGMYGFWMKEMLFPIDIIWIDANRRVVDAWGGATPDSYPQVRTPVAPAKYVLEVNAGFVKMYSIKRGDVLELDSSSRYNEEESGRVK